MLNTCTIMGRLTRDPELRRTGTGLAVTSFCVAVDRDWPNKETGERETDFINCVAWRQTGEFVSKWFSKGSMIVVSGRLQMRKWTDDSGNNRTTYEIVADNVYFGEGKKDKTESTTPGPYATTQNPYSGPWMYGGVKPAVSDFAMLDDDDAQLPF